MKQFALTAIAVVALSSAACTSVQPSHPTARRAETSNAGWDISNLPHWRVDYWVDRFSNGDKRPEFETSLTRKPQYEEMIRRKLREREMPEDLLYLPMIESGFNPQARSAAGAAGMWQLVSDTARRFGLQVNESVDERLDPEGSTDAALSYLAKLHDRFGSWYLAAAAYNTGENRVARIMVEETGSERGTDEDYYRIWDKLPGETRDFVPVMIAAARLSKDPARYGFSGASEGVGALR